MVRHLISVGVALALASSANAQPNYENGRYKTTVIEDRGGVSIRKYIPQIQSSEEWVKERYQDRGDKKLVTGMYPVRTPSMKVGRVMPGEGDKIPKFAMATRQMFIIGDDPVSRNWLAKNREFLRNKKAIGLVVNVENEQRMAELKQIAGHGLLLQPTQGESLARIMGIKHYPFYVDSDGIMR